MKKHGAFGRSEKFSVLREECSRGGVSGDQTKENRLKSNPKGLWVLGQEI